MPTDDALTPADGDALAAPDAGQAQAWAAVRARLGIDSAWLTAAAFRAVPVAVTDPDVLGGRSAVADRWGRVYVDFDAEASRGIVKLADAVRAAVLDWVSGQAPHATWFAHRLDDRFPAVAPAQTAAAAHAAAAGIASSPAPAYGTDPFGGWREWALREAGVPQVSWRQQLGAGLRSAIATQRGHQLHTYTRPSRRQQPGLVLPARRGPDIGVAVIADISGSAAPDLPTILAEIGQIIASVGLLGGTTTLYGVDDEVASVTALPGPLPDLSPRPGHVTDLRAGFAAAARGRRGAGRAPEVTVVLSDGLTAWPERAPAGRTIVALIGSRTVTGKAAGQVPAWAQVLHIDTTKES